MILWKKKNVKPAVDVDSTNLFFLTILFFKLFAFSNNISYQVKAADDCNYYEWYEPREFREKCIHAADLKKGCNHIVYEVNAHWNQDIVCFQVKNTHADSEYECTCYSAEIMANGKYE